MRKLYLVIAFLTALNLVQAQTDPRIYDIIQTVSAERIE